MEISNSSILLNPNYVTKICAMAELPAPTVESTEQIENSIRDIIPLKMVCAQFTCITFQLTLS